MKSVAGSDLTVVSSSAKDIYREKNKSKNKKQ